MKNALQELNESRILLQEQNERLKKLKPNFRRWQAANFALLFLGVLSVTPFIGVPHMVTVTLGLISGTIAMVSQALFYIKRHEVNKKIFKNNKQIAQNISVIDKNISKDLNLYQLKPANVKNETRTNSKQTQNEETLIQ